MVISMFSASFGARARWEGGEAGTTGSAPPSSFAEGSAGRDAPEEWAATERGPTGVLVRGVSDQKCTRKIGDSRGTKPCGTDLLVMIGTERSSTGVLVGDAKYQRSEALLEMKQMGLKIKL